MIRGAIAFALVMRIPKVGEESCTSLDPVRDCFSYQNYDLMVTTTFVLVVFTTLVFGTFMALMGRILVPPKQTDVEPEHAQDADTSHHHLIEHPNEVPDLDDTLHHSSTDSTPSKKFFAWKNSGLVNWYSKFDKSTLRPIFVRDKHQQLDKDEMDDRFERMMTLPLKPEDGSNKDESEEGEKKNEKSDK
jgi:NhaP-type Na+/H+ or K+/H+ antiporter